MSAAKLTSKGQITLPLSVRERLRLAAGDRVEFVETEAGFLMRATGSDVRELKTILPPRSEAVSIEEMNAAISRMGRDTR